MGRRQHPVPRRGVSPLHPRDVPGQRARRRTHRANGKPAPLGAIKCPTLVITASRDSICPSPAATALLDHVGATDTSIVTVAGGHVGAVVGSKAAKEMYPALIKWLAPRLA